MGKKQKYYVVWAGHKTGVFTSWGEVTPLIKGYKGAKYKSFPTLEEAEKAYADGYSATIKREQETPETEQPILRSIAVDAACSGNPGKMEYRGVSLWDNKQIFHMSFDLGTNNIGEFLAIVHALAMLQKQGIDNVMIYSDSRIAMGWVNSGVCKTKLEQTPLTAHLLTVVRRAETWLKNNTFRVPIVKWPTKAWGEIPADFGRK